MAMASSVSVLSILLLFLVALLAFPTPRVAGHVEETSLKLVADTLEWPLSTSMYEDFDEDEDDAGEEEEGGISRRSLFWKRMRYYISYGALSANRVPCPPRSGRSYYTPNCFRHRGPVHPYNRGCSQIARCRR